MRKHKFGDIFQILPSQPLKGTFGAFNKGHEAVCISSEIETESGPCIMAVKLSNKIEFKDYNNLTVMLRTGSGKRYMKLLTASPVPKYRIGKKLGEISDDEKTILKERLKLLFDI